MGFREAYRRTIFERIAWAPDEPDFHVFTLDVRDAVFIRFGDEPSALRWDETDGFRRDPPPGRPDRLRRHRQPLRVAERGGRPDPASCRWDPVTLEHRREHRHGATLVAGAGLGAPRAASDRNGPQPRLGAVAIAQEPLDQQPGVAPFVRMAGKVEGLLRKRYPRSRGASFDHVALNTEHPRRCLRS